MPTKQVFAYDSMPHPVGATGSTGPAATPVVLAVKGAATSPALNTVTFISVVAGGTTVVTPDIGTVLALSFTAIAIWQAGQINTVVQYEFYVDGVSTGPIYAISNPTASAYQGSIAIQTSVSGLSAGSHNIDVQAITDAPGVINSAFNFLTVLGVG